MRVISIANYKGGTCKTTTALNLAAELHSRGQRVLLMDCDSSANATVGIGLEPAQPPPLLYALDVPPAPLADGIMTSDWGIDVVPSGKRLTFVDQVIDEHDDPALALRHAIQTLPRNAYDVVLIDCPAQYGVMTRLAMAASDEVLVPVEVKSSDSLDGLVTLWRDMTKVQKRDNPSLRSGGILICRADRTRLSREVVKDLDDHPTFGQLLLRTPGGQPLVIRESVAVAEARMRQVPIRAHDPDGNGTTDFNALATCVLERINHMEAAA